MTLTDDVSTLELAATHELRRLGWTRHELVQGVSHGEILRVRQGWYALPATPTPALEAARVGGRLTCVSAARMLGLAAPRTTALHVAVLPRASRLRDRRDHRIRLRQSAAVVVHWRDDAVGSRLVRPVIDSLLDMSYCQPAEMTVAAADSAIHAGILELDEWLLRTKALPAGLRSVVRQVDARSESIIESVTRVRLRALGLEPGIQVRIPGVGRVDLLLGRRLVIELDGMAFHSDRERFEADRARDARASIRGYRVLRFSYRQVMTRWSQVRAAVLAAVARGDHLS